LGNFVFADTVTHYRLVCATRNIKVFWHETLRISTEMLLLFKSTNCLSALHRQAVTNICDKKDAFYVSSSFNLSIQLGNRKWPDPCFNKINKYTLGKFKTSVLYFPQYVLPPLNVDPTQPIMCKIETKYFLYR